MGRKPARQIPDPLIHMRDLVELVSTVVGEYTALSAKKQIAFTFIRPDLPFPRLLFDSARLSLALHGVIDNAFRYTKDGGTITVRVEKEATHAVVTVEDTGIGIPRRQQERLFTKFFRAENAVRMVPDGSGLGLFIVRNIVERHGGTVGIASEENVGTRMSFTLPFDKTTIPQREEVV